MERVQKCTLKILLKNKYTNYQNALNTLNLLTLDERREQLLFELSKKCCKNPKMTTLFSQNRKIHPMDTRKQEKINVTHANTSRFCNSPVIAMQNILNKIAWFWKCSRTDSEFLYLHNVCHLSSCKCFITVIKLSLSIKLN